MQQSACQRRKLTTVKRRKKSCRKKPICKSQAKSMCRANLNCKSNRKPKKSCRKSKSKLQKRFSKPKPMKKCVKKAGEQYIIYLNDVPSNSQSPNHCIIWRSCKAFSNFMNEYRAKCSDPDASDVMQNGARAWQMLTNLQQSKYHHPVI
ncbi:uncharacterized protein LOC111081118 [Drosophila obscura]|uniref:uncharacterized protein LOC111081118 n=1 Tax=Drosophila obscura TaxID=7282 RepID=UPI001BB1BA19|nr:uncharacterized protein LOC111081118 [Drosophila obscura]